MQYVDPAGLGVKLWELTGLGWDRLCAGVPQSW